MVRRGVIIDNRAMLMDLKKALVVGDTVPLTLEFVDAAGRRGIARLDVPVRASPAAGGGDAASAVHRH